MMRMNFRQLFKRLLIGAMVCLAVSSTAVLVLGTPADALAGRLELYDGQQLAVCRDYDEQLKSLGDLQPAFEWPLNPEFKQFRKPTWQPLDPRQHLDAIKRIFEPPPHDPKWRGATWRGKPWIWEQEWREGWLPLITAAIESGEGRLEKADVDHDHDGKEETILRWGWKFYRAKLSGEELFGWQYGLDDEALNKRFKKSVIISPRYDSFLYRDRFYLIWQPRSGFLINSKPPWGEVHVLEPKIIFSGEQLALVPVCKFWFRPSEGDLR